MTEHYGFKKPDLEDSADVSVLNETFDQIDTKLHEAMQDVENAVEDAKNASGVVISNEEPENTDKMWLDTGNGGILKYYDGTQWVPSVAVWG